VIHELKTLTLHFNEVWAGRKTAELRKDDRGFELGHHLLLEDWDVVCGQGVYLGRSVLVEITCITRHSPALQDRYVMLSFNLLERRGHDLRAGR